MPIAKVRGIDLSHEVTGEEGDVVLFVNGGFVDRTNWLLVVPILAESFRLVTFDGRGHGQSSGEVREDPFVNIEDLAALIEFVDAGPVHVVGNSGGGLYAMHLAARRPDLFRSLSVNEPPFTGLLADDPLGEVMRRALAETAARFQEGAFEDGLRVFCAFVGIDWEPFPLKDLLLNNVHNYVGEWFADATHPLWTPDFEGLKGFPHPVQLTTGSETVPALAAITQRLATLVPAVQLAVIDGAGHGPMFDRPTEYSAALSRFLKHAGAA